MDDPPAFSARSIVKPKAMRPPIMATTGVAYVTSVKRPKKVKLKAIVATAATPAPADTPMMYGSTIGLRMMA